MIIVCPKCQTKLKIADEKIKPEGTKFKCPKCTVVLNVRKPAPKPAAPEAVSQPKPASAPMPEPAPRPAPSTIASSFEALKPAPPIPAAPAAPAAKSARKVLVAHENPNVAQRIEQALTAMGMSVVRAMDGVQVIINALKEQAVIAFVDPAMSKINGYELAKRLKDRQELKGIKVILVSSAHDPVRLKRTLASAPEVDAYIDEDEIGSGLPAVIRSVLAPRTESAQPAAQLQAPIIKPPVAATHVIPTTDAGEDEGVKKAKRLARTVLSDIALYNPDKVNKSIIDGTFEQVFEGDLKEGLKHYNNRVPEDIRSRKDYFREALENFIESKKGATRNS